MTPAQRIALQNLCARYGEKLRESDFAHPFDLPDGWVAGWVGQRGTHGNPIYVGCSPEGDIHS